MPSPDPLAGLLAAAKLSPDNVPLLRHLAESLANLGRFDEAEAEWKAILARQPQEPAALLGLAGDVPIAPPDDSNWRVLPTGWPLHLDCSRHGGLVRFRFSAPHSF